MKSGFGGEQGWGVRWWEAGGDSSRWPFIAAASVFAACALVAYGMVFADWAFLPFAMVLVGLVHLPSGIYLLLAAAMIFEQFQIFGIEMPLTAQVPIYLNLNLTSGIGALVVNPIELLLVAMIVGWAIRAASSREWHFRPIPHWEVAALFLGMLLLYTAYGLARGGDVRVALWEIRALYYLCGVFFLATQVIRTERQVQICLWIAIIGTTIKGLQGCSRFFIDLRGSIVGVQAITGHEDALFIAVALMFLAALLCLGAWQRLEFWVLTCATPALFLTFILTQRRVAYGVLGLNLVLLFLLLPFRRKLFSLRFVLPLLPVLVLYTGIFWNSHSTLALPIRQVRSIFVIGVGEDTSNVYRRIENFNLEQTIRQSPLGTGFGKKYLVLFPLPYVDFPLWDYIPHNCIYWIWAKTGFPGFLVFWLFFGVYTIQAIIDYRHETDPFYKAVCVTVATFIIGQMVVAYYDLQITFYRNMIYLGVAMAIPVAIRNRPSLTETEKETPAETPADAA